MYVFILYIYIHTHIIYIYNNVWVSKGKKIKVFTIPVIVHHATFQSTYINKQDHFVKLFKPK